MAVAVVTAEPGIGAVPLVVHGGPSVAIACLMYLACQGKCHRVRPCHRAPRGPAGSDRAVLLARACGGQRSRHSVPSRPGRSGTVGDGREALLVLGRSSSPRSRGRTRRWPFGGFDGGGTGNGRRAGVVAGLHGGQPESRTGSAGSTWRASEALENRRPSGCAWRSFYPVNPGPGCRAETTSQTVQPARLVCAGGCLMSEGADDRTAAATARLET